MGLAQLEGCDATITFMGWIPPPMALLNFIVDGASKGNSGPNGMEES